MKKGLLILFTLLVVSSVFAIAKGSMMVGGQAGFTISKSNSDADPLTTILIAPELGYFLIDNMCADVILSIESHSQNDDSDTNLGLGIGGRYFYNNLYAGLDVRYESWTSDYSARSKYSVSSMYGTLKAGYLLPVTPSVFADLRGHYTMGLGDYGSDGSGANERSEFGVTAGFQILLGK